MAETMTAPAVGRDMDQVVAQKLMGWVWLEARGEKWLGLPDEAERPPENAFAFQVYLADLSDESLVTQEPWWLDPEKAHLGTIVPHYSTDIGAAWKVLEAIHKGNGYTHRWYFSQRRRFYEELAGLCRLPTGERLAWPDAMGPFAAQMPEFICRAALAASAELA